VAGEVENHEIVDGVIGYYALAQRRISRPARKKNNGNEKIYCLKGGAGRITFRREVRMVGSRSHIGAEIRARCIKSLDRGKILDEIL